MTCIATALQAGLLLQVSSRQCNNGICSFDWLLESRPFKLVQDGSMFCSSQFKVDLTISRKNTILNTVHFNTNTTWLKEELYIIFCKTMLFWFGKGLYIKSNTKYSTTTLCLECNGGLACNIPIPKPASYWYIRLLSMESIRIWRWYLRFWDIWLRLFWDTWHGFLNLYSTQTMIMWCSFLCVQ